MARIFTTDGVLIAKAMRDFLNSWPSKPMDIGLEDFKKEAPSMMLQQLAAAEKKKTYINGSYVGVWNFAVYVRINAVDTASRLDATGILQALADWMADQDEQGNFVNLPTLDGLKKPMRIDMTTTPSIAARYEDGTEDYQAIFVFEYKATRR